MGNTINHIRTGKKVPCKVCGKLVYRKGCLLKKLNFFYCSRSCKGRTSFITTKGIPRPWLEGENNHEWKGEDVGYQALHDWIRKIKGTPKKCDFCRSTIEKKYEWANISKKYKRDVNDWKRLCSRCHAIYDKKSENMIKKRKQKLWSTKSNIF